MQPNNHGAQSRSPHGAQSGSAHGLPVIFAVRGATRRRNAPLTSALSVRHDGPRGRRARVKEDTMSKIVAGWPYVVLGLVLMLAEPSFSQTPPRGVPAPPPGNPPQRLTPSLQQPVPSPNPAPLQSPPQPDAAPSPATPGQPADATQQRARPGKVVSSRHHETKPRDHEGEGRGADTSYVTPWSGPHVIERAHGYAAFVVEGSWYRARSVCPGWVAGERVSLRVGPSGWCSLVNRTRHRTCLVSCEGRAGWGPYL